MWISPRVLSSRAILISSWTKSVFRSIATNLTYPERVTPYNIAYLQELVRNSSTIYPGARYVVRDTGEHIDSRYDKHADASLQYGWIIKWHLKDGGWV
ncbi:hypothetical protein K503DRAFT_479476 [Rhizopogon vinicolor AM-OR11-026]|uniref:RNA polymerase alpha subunit domain-containing protein n=1 Tax=Rhizopogon vinicolor AM-OR11-026 TaxID=1314800 RepID=A0A1B7MN01_9AGAM|nr:hypothetical protein K503DRAFT_479476 [Rhizopogon vinicolor AM-OR11-026]